MRFLHTVFEIIKGGVEKDITPFLIHWGYTGIILCIRPANERRRYNVTSLIGWAHTQNDPWLHLCGAVPLV